MYDAFRSHTLQSCAPCDVLSPYSRKQEGLVSIGVELFQAPSAFILRQVPASPSARQSIIASIQRHAVIVTSHKHQRVVIDLYIRRM